MKLLFNLCQYKFSNMHIKGKFTNPKNVPEREGRQDRQKFYRTLIYILWKSSCLSVQGKSYRSQHFRTHASQINEQVTYLWYIFDMQWSALHRFFCMLQVVWTHTLPICLLNPVNVVIISNWLRTSCISSANTSRMISIIVIHSKKNCAIIYCHKCTKKNPTVYELIFLMKIEVLFQNNSDKVHEAQWSDTEPLTSSTNYITFLHSP